METIEGNKLIAGFMGHEVMEEEAFLSGDYEQGKDMTNIRVDVSLRYHESWDWLMPVVEKIEDIQDGNEGDSIRGHIYEVTIKQGNIVTIQGDGCSIWADASPKILSVWIAVVEFIKWYNQNK